MSGHMTCVYKSIICIGCDFFTGDKFLRPGIEEECPRYQRNIKTPVIFLTKRMGGCGEVFLFGHHPIDDLEERLKKLGHKVVVERILSY